MSERLRKAYEKKEIERIKKVVELKNKKHLDRMRLAGKRFNERREARND